MKSVEWSFMHTTRVILKYPPKHKREKLILIKSEHWLGAYIIIDILIPQYWIVLYACI